MEEYRIDIKVKNNIILYKIEQAGYKTVSEFCRLNGVMKYLSQICEIINMKASPLQINGEFKKFVVQIADLLGCAPEDLFSDVQLHTVLKTNKKTLKVNEAELKFMLENYDSHKLLEDNYSDDQLSKTIEESLSMLHPRIKKVIEMRLGLGEYNCAHTLEQCAQAFGVQRERIRQLEAKGLRQLRHPRISEKLKEYY